MSVFLYIQTTTLSVGLHAKLLANMYIVFSSGIFVFKRIRILLYTILRFKPPKLSSPLTLNDVALHKNKHTPTVVSLYIYLLFEKLHYIV